MTHGGELLTASGALWAVPRELGRLGHHGVILFFVLSGFVIPYSLMRSGVDASLRSFLVKRMIRLGPPFMAACVGTLILNLLSMQVPGYAGPLGSDYLSQSLLQLAADNVYISGILGRPWILVVAWTLAIEVQFYCIAGLSRRCLIKRPYVLLAAAAVMSLLIPWSATVFHWLPMFALGALVAVRFPSWSCRDAVLAAVFLVLIGFTFNPAEAWLALLSLGMIVLAVHDMLPRVPLLSWMGGISYSLYLVHVPIGGRVVNLAARVSSGPLAQLLICLVGVLVSIAAAWLFWRFVELPSHQWSRQF